MNKQQIANKILVSQNLDYVTKGASAFAPSNIALCKYWGKRDENINLPVTSSLSISLAELGTHTKVSYIEQKELQVLLNGTLVENDSEFYLRIKNFLQAIVPDLYNNLKVETDSNIPIAAGVASSASGFAALTMALKKMFAWSISDIEMSILARLGSGSAARSIKHGFMLWQAGHQQDGMDSYAYKLPYNLPELNLGLVILDKSKKAISSTIAMQQTLLTSPFYPEWKVKAQKDLISMQQALANSEISSIGEIAEHNAMCMHSLMASAWPTISYTGVETLKIQNAVHKLRSKGIVIYFTQDAGPNIKLIFSANDLSIIKKHFPEMLLVKPFGD